MEKIIDSSQTKEINILKHQIDTLKREKSEIVKENKLNKELNLRRKKVLTPPTFEDLSHEIPSDFRMGIDRDDLDPNSLSQDQRTMREDGLLIKPGFIPEHLCDTYWEERIKVEKETVGFHAWGGNYMALPQMKDICLYPPLGELLKHLSGIDMGLFLTLANVRTTKRSWHQDFYLSPGYSNTHYFAVWIAVGDIHPDSGPFEFIRGSHKLPTLRQELIYDYLNPKDRQTSAWPQLSEELIAPLVSKKINNLESPPEKFLAKKGDLLIWHHSLLHQGTIAKNTDLLRPALIAHYNSVPKLKHMRKIVTRDPKAGQYFSDRNDWNDSFPADYFGLIRK